MRARLVLAGTAAALCLGSASSALAAAGPPPVTVHVGTENGGVQVGTGIPGQPLVGAHADNRGICAGFSYQVPFCLELATD